MNYYKIVLLVCTLLISSAYFSSAFAAKTSPEYRIVGAAYSAVSQNGALRYMDSSGRIYVGYIAANLICVEAFGKSARLASTEDVINTHNLAEVVQERSWVRPSDVSIASVPGEDATYHISESPSGVTDQIYGSSVGVHQFSCGGYKSGTLDGLTVSLKSRDNIVQLYFGLQSCDNQLPVLCAGPLL